MMTARMKADTAGTGRLEGQGASQAAPATSHVHLHITVKEEAPPVLHTPASAPVPRHACTNDHCTVSKLLTHILHAAGCQTCL